MDIKEVQKELGEHWNGYQTALAEALANDNMLLSRINTYLIHNAGKQLRPVLSLLAANACGNITRENYACAAVCEMVHTATLLHDDVADDGNMRRGVPTVKAVFNQAASVLAGDYWLARALRLLTDKCPRGVLDCFALALQELSEGEIIQMEKAEALDTTEEDYYRIIARKTASLFIASVKGGAICAQASPLQIGAVAEYAYHLGLAFQIQDDIFDYSPDLKTGKIAGSDIKERKITLPLLGAIFNNPSRTDYITGLISGIPNSIGKGEETGLLEKEIIGEVNDFVRQNKGIEYAQDSLGKHTALACDALAALPDTRAKMRLCELAEYVGKRNN